MKVNDSDQISLLLLIQEDRRVNSHVKSKFILLLYRLANRSGYSKNKFLRIGSKPYRGFYRFVVDWVLGVDIPWKARIGRRPILYHSFGLVINEAAIIGDDCVLRHGVTIGNKVTAAGESGSPIVGNRVEFGVGAIVLGSIRIGDDVVIGAGTVVTKNVTTGLKLVGSSFRVL